MGKIDPSHHDRVVAHDLLGDPNYPWRKMLALAAAHRVHPILAHNLEIDDSFRARVPAEFQGSLRAFRAQALMRNALYRQTIAPIVQRLTAENIPLALMKGAALTETVFPRGTRLLNDFDVLINKSDYPKVTAAFVDAGFFKRFRAGATESSELAAYHQVGLVKRVGETVLSVDLHWLLYPPEHAFCQIDTPTLMARSQRITFGETTAFVLSREDTIVHYASQIVNDSLNVSYQRMGDLYALAKSAPSWESTVDIARSAGAAGATHFGLAVALMLGANVPAWASSQLEKACIGCHVATRQLAAPQLTFRRRAAPHEVPILVALFYSRQRDRISYLGRFVVARWKVSRQYRGTLRTCVVAVQRLTQATHWVVKLVAVYAGRWPRWEIGRL